MAEKEVMLLGTEKKVDYFYECVKRLVEHQDQIQLSHWFSPRFYSGKCTEHEIEKLLQTVNKCIKELQYDKGYIIIKEPFFYIDIAQTIGSDKEYYKCKRVSYWKFKRYNPSTMRKDREPLIIP